jgi:preprotein translocase subunit SecA
VEIKARSHITASITFQTLFKYYQKLAGMTVSAKSGLSHDTAHECCTV